MSQTAIPVTLMRGGTSKGPYIRRGDLPADEATLARVLLALMGSPDDRQIDGLGGAAWLTTKAAMVEPSARDDADVDYLFGQVLIDRGHVDFAPNCGNMTAGVGPFAIESGMVAPTGGETTVRIHNVNTGALIEAIVQTPGGAVRYDGDAAIDGVPGTAAPIRLYFSGVVGSKTGKLLPTGNAIDTFGGIEVSCVDTAVPMVIARAADMGKTGYESKAELDADTGFLARLEAIRVEASHAMGLGDPTGSVVPKFCIVSEARSGGTVNARYFVPRECHATFPLTGGMCLSAASVIDASIIASVAKIPAGNHLTLAIEHPVGVLETVIDYTGTRAAPEIQRVGFLRTARKLMQGTAFIPADVWDGKS